MGKPTELNGLSDHDLLMKLCVLVERLNDNMERFEQRMLAIEEGKISKIEVKEILADSAKVKTELYERVTGLEQGNTDYQKTQSKVIEKHEIQLESLKGFYQRTVAIGSIISFLLTCAMVYFMAK